MKRFLPVVLILTLMLFLGACGSDEPAQQPDPAAKTEETTGALETVEVTFAHGLDDDMGPHDPGNTFQPADAVYLSVKLKGNPKTGLVSARYFYGSQEITEVSLDLAELWAEEGLIFAVGGNTQVGFTLTPDSAFPPGDEYSARLYLDGKQAGTYQFVVEGEVVSDAPPAEPTPVPEVVEATVPPAEGGLVRSEHSVSINALWYATDMTGRAIGGVSPTRISVRPASNPGELRVGFFEEEVGGSGPMWRSAGWTAVVVSSQLLGIDPRDYEFSYSVGGSIDGPSAGTYMTVGTLAALLGDEVRQDAAMTGTINPDGTIGPVGGIPQKIEGAANQGAVLVLVPAGLRYDVDGNSGQLVDVVEVGKALGVEVREVSTVFEAYEYMTGHALPQPKTSAAAPQLPPRAFDRTRAKALEWLSRYQDARGRYNSLSPEISELFIEEIGWADQTATSADSALQQGLAAVAYQRAVNAAFQAQMYLLVGEVVQRYAVGSIDDGIDYLIATKSALTEKNAVVELLRTEQPRSASDHIALFDAYTNIGQAEGLAVLADGQINQLSANMGDMAEEDVLGKLAEISAYYILAKDFVQLARDSVDIGFGYGTEIEVSPERVEAMSELMRHAADANIDYFESTIVDQAANNWGVHNSVAKDLFMNFDWDYLFAVASDYGVQSLSASLKDPAQQTPLVLGNSVSNYAQSAALVAKHYSLGAQFDAEGTVVSIANERALADMLDLADRRARELISLNGDDVPVTAVLYYESARLSRQGVPEDQLSALQSYWSAATLAQVQAYLSGVIGQ